MKTFRRAFGAALLALGIATPAMAQDLPPLPSGMRAAGVLRAGVRCDQPPYGFRGADGGFAGVEVEMARQMATWAFGSPDKVELTCVTAENRIPQLNARRVDFLIATLGVTPDRARVIDFSNPYRWGGSDILVRQNSPIRRLDDVAGRTVIMLRGSTQALWFDANMPNLNTLRLNTASDALTALLQGRGDAYSHDAATLIVIAARDPSLRLVGEPFGVTDAAVGVRKNEPEWMAWVNAALDRMKREDLYNRWVAQWVPEETRAFYLSAFNDPRPAAR
ncbi:transporter substrate-binding domain-containing protein [Rhodovarius crocodyli]|uniref:Transporter substrate-binding domain-containing protein n=1 Tax=Rhodovarius crocodyli TaxID=1979269 RepID=A0A437MJJ0_9PROT|nr:transporter substrate-binding domain-containing protein [Rhodovarius crocodyli]RVT97776.1 transporter substrate-binding domain-containing protein [Rhodovarius crocodyli]